jgi:hypothetical protein
VKRYIKEREFLNVIMIGGWAASITRFVIKHYKELKSDTITGFIDALKDLIKQAS